MAETSGVTAETMLTLLRAVGEETRLRITALLQHGELTVSDLTDILGQSQPRISRHLKLLAEAGVVTKHREGTWVFFDLADTTPTHRVVVDILAHTDVGDSVLAADLDRLSIVRNRRAAAAQQYFAGIADSWDEERSLHAAESDVEAAILGAVADIAYRSLLDLGTGTGRMLQLLAGPNRPNPAPLDRVVGLDSSHSMLAVARANLERSGLGGFELRQGDVYSPPFERDQFDLIVIHQVLHFLDHPARAVQEASRLLKPGGRLLIVDFAPHNLEFLRTDHAHRRLGFANDTVDAWLHDLDLLTHRSIKPPDGVPVGAGRLTVSLWVASDRRAMASSTNELCAS